MKNILFLLLIVSTTKLFSQSKSFDYAYFNKKGICAYSISEQKEYVIVSKGQDPNISPDGKKIAYTASNKNGDRYIAVIDINTKKKTTPKTQSNNSYGPVWSPDGKLIAYNYFDDQKKNWFIAVIDTNNSPPLLLTAKLKASYSPSWANHGKNLVVHDMKNLYVFDLHGNITQTFDIGKFHTEFGTASSDQFIFSSDNKKIVFTSAVDEPGDDTGPPSAVFVYDVSTKTSKRLSPKGYDTGPFTTINNNVIFSASKYNSSTSNTYSIDLDGTNFKKFLVSGHWLSSRN